MLLWQIKYIYNGVLLITKPAIKIIIKLNRNSFINKKKWMRMTKAYKKTLQLKMKTENIKSKY